MIRITMKWGGTSTPWTYLAVSCCQQNLPLEKIFYWIMGFRYELDKSTVIGHLSWLKWCNIFGQFWGFSLVDAVHMEQPTPLPTCPQQMRHESHIYVAKNLLCRKAVRKYFLIPGLNECNDCTFPKCTGHKKITLTQPSNATSRIKQKFLLPSLCLLRSWG